MDNYQESKAVVRIKSEVKKKPPVRRQN